ncbi:MAG: hypothetical protein ACXADU_16920 [Promethearchaeota archaeon]
MSASRCSVFSGLSSWVRQACIVYPRFIRAITTWEPTYPEAPVTATGPSEGVTAGIFPPIYNLIQNY